MCPNGCKKYPLSQPDYETDWHTWDCFECGLTLPRSVDLECERLIGMWRDVSLRPILVGLFPELVEGFGTMVSILDSSEKAQLDQLHELLDCVQNDMTLSGLDEFEGRELCGTLAEVLYAFFQHHETIRMKLEDWESSFARKNPPRHFDQ